MKANSVRYKVEGVEVYIARNGLSAEFSIGKKRYTKVITNKPISKSAGDCAKILLRTARASIIKLLEKT